MFKNKFDHFIIFFFFRQWALWSKPRNTQSESLNKHWKLGINSFTVTRQDFTLSDQCVYYHSLISALKRHSGLFSSSSLVTIRVNLMWEKTLRVRPKPPVLKQHAFLQYITVLMVNCILLSEFGCFFTAIFLQCRKQYNTLIHCDSQSIRKWIFKLTFKVAVTVTVVQRFPHPKSIYFNRNPHCLEFCIWFKEGSVRSCGFTMWTNRNLLDLEVCCPSCITTVLTIDIGLCCPQNRIVNCVKILSPIVISWRL